MLLAQYHGTEYGEMAAKREGAVNRPGVESVQDVEKPYWDAVFNMSGT